MTTDELNATASRHGVVSLEWAKKLKEVGYPQDESIFVYQQGFGGEWVLKYRQDTAFKDWREFYAAPHCAELGEKLKEQNYCSRMPFYNKESKTWDWINFDKEPYTVIESATESNARAKLYCYLREKGLIEK